MIGWILVLLLSLGNVQPMDSAGGPLARTQCQQASTTCDTSTASPVKPLDSAGGPL
jgi:hypothetical protein